MFDAHVRLFVRIAYFDLCRTFGEYKAVEAGIRGQEANSKRSLNKKLTCFLFWSYIFSVIILIQIMFRILWEGRELGP